MKKTIALVLTLLISIGSLLVPTLAFADDALVVTVEDGSLEEKGLESVDWFKAENGEYYFFIPSYWDASELTVRTSAQAKLGDADIVSGEALDLGTSGTITSGGKEYKYNVVASSGVGTVFITTESGSLDAVNADKSVKEPGEVAIYNAKGKLQNDDKELSYIKGRGNASWKGAKKPYNIKLNSKAKLLGMNKSKKWCLIANMDDLSLMRNAMTYTAAAQAGLDYSPENAPVDLYINNNYMGSYLLTSKIEAAGARIDVEDLDEVNEDICIAEYGDDFDMDTLAQGGVYGSFSGLLEGNYKYVEIPETEDSTTDGGYILEMEIANRYAGEKSGFVSNDGQPITMKSPEYASKAQMEFISGYYQRFEDAIISPEGKNGDGEDYKDLIDVESFAKYYDICEWTSNVDTGLTSTYLYMDTTKDGKLYAGPVWDYDIAFGNTDISRYGNDYTDPAQFTVCYSRQYRNTIFGQSDVDEKANVFNYLCQKADFLAECKSVWDSGVYEAVSAWSGETFDEYAETVTDSAVMNHIRWNSFGTGDADEVKAAYLKEVSTLRDFASKRVEFMNSHISDARDRQTKTNFFVKIGKKLAAGINNIFEKLIVVFRLENKTFSFYEY